MMAPGTNTTVTLPITADDLAYSLPDGTLMAVPGVWRVRVEDSEAVITVL